MTEEELESVKAERKEYEDKLTGLLAKAKKDLRIFRKSRDTEKISFLQDLIKATKKDMKALEKLPVEGTIIEQIEIDENHPNYQHGSWVRPLKHIKMRDAND